MKTLFSFHRTLSDGSRPSPRRRHGFSLIEVNMALLVAAGGMLAIFGLFPGALRQSINAQTDTTQITFASSLLETISANVRSIDDIGKWNDPAEWWKIASNGTGLSNSMKAISSFKSDSSFSPMTRLVVEDYDTQSFGDDRYCQVWYVGNETDDPNDRKNPRESELAKPMQYLIRIVRQMRPVRVVTSNSANGNSQSANLGTSEDASILLPHRYIVSVISTDSGSPSAYIHEQVSSQEYVFLSRP